MVVSTLNISDLFLCDIHLSFIAKEEIISLNTTHCNANDIAIAVGADAQITQAYDLKVVDTAKNVSDNNEKAEI